MTHTVVTLQENIAVARTEHAKHTMVKTPATTALVRHSRFAALTVPSRSKTIVSGKGASGRGVASISATATQNEFLITYTDGATDTFTFEPTGGGASFEESRAAGEAIAAPAVCVLIGGSAYLADCSTEAHRSKPKLIATSSAQAGQLLTLQHEGIVETPGWGLTPDVPAFLGASGSLIDVPPSSGFVQRIGTPQTADIFEIDIAPPIKL